MDVLVLWAGFIGAWLLVNGPLLQGSIELWEIGRKGQGDVELKPIDNALWLFPPALYVVQLQRIRRYERGHRDSSGRTLSAAFVNRASGWFAVAAGAALIAVKETWELAEHYEIGTGSFWLIIAALTLASIVNVAVRMWRFRRNGRNDAREASRDDAADPDLPHVPLIEAAADDADLRPSWRGWIHAGAFPLAIVLGIVLLVIADGPTATFGSAVFFGTSLLLFGNSALYHRIRWSPPVKKVFRRLDHANIFLLIAGSCTPIALLCLPQPQQAIALGLVWGGSVLGIAFRVFWLGAPRWSYVPLYIAVGATPVVFIGDFYAANATMMTLILAGGVLYIGGAIVYGLKRPNPIPGTFGFHEIFHTCTLLAFLCHWSGIALVAANPPLL